MQAVIQAEWQDLFSDKAAVLQLENQVLPAYLKRMRWFGGKARPSMSVLIYQNIPIEAGNDFTHYLLLKVRYPEFPTDIYALPIAFIAERRFNDMPSEAIIARLDNLVSPGYLIDAVYLEEFRNALFQMMQHSKKLLASNHYPMIADGGKLLQNSSVNKISSKVLSAEQSNTSLVFNNQFFLKFFRKLEYTINPDLEIIRYLTEQEQFHQIPGYAGAIEVLHPEKPPMLAVMLQRMIENAGNAWDWNLQHLQRFYEQVMETGFDKTQLPERPPKHHISWEETPAALQQLIGQEVYQQASLLGKRTAELHLALGKDAKNPDFGPEQFDKTMQQSYCDSLQKLLIQKFDLLQRNLARIPESMQAKATEMLDDRENVIEFIQKITTQPAIGTGIRTHGDFHLGQVLVAGNDLVILDFEGEPDKPFNQRRKKTSPLKDVAGMMRSYRYAAYAVLLTKFENAPQRQESLFTVADLWYHFVSRYFLGAYLDTMKGSHLLPAGEAFNETLQIFSFEKAIYELGYELNNRPDWAIIPLISLAKFVKFYL